MMCLLAGRDLPLHSYRTEKKKKMKKKLCHKIQLNYID